MPSGKNKIDKLAPAGKNRDLHVCGTGEPVGEAPALAKAELQARIDGIEELRRVSFYSAAFQTWYRETEDLLARIFGAASSPREDFQAILFTPLFLSCRCGDTVFTEAYEKGLEEACSLLTSCMKKALNSSPLNP